MSDLTFDSELLTFDGRQLMYDGVPFVTSRIYNQYSKNPKLIQWLNITLGMVGDLFTTSLKVRRSYNIDKASLHELDILERLVVVKTRIDVSTVPVDVDITRVRRLILKATISKNVSNATYDSVLEAIEYLTGDDNITIIDTENMAFNIQFSKELTNEQRYVLSNYDIVPRMTAVKFTGYSEVGTLTQFGGTGEQFGGDSSQFTFYYGT